MHIRAMKLSRILEIVEGTIVCGADRLNEEVSMAFASDLMSDVLTLPTVNVLLITGLSNIQTIRTADMADINYVLLARGKKASPELIQLASEHNMVVIETPYSMFRTCGILYDAGLSAVY